EQRARGARHRQRFPQRRAVLLQADARDRVLLRLRRVPGRARRVPLPRHAARRRRVLPQGQLPLPAMTAPARASLEDLLAAEQLAKRRQYVLANTRARWGLVGFAIVLLTAMRLARVVVFPGEFLVGFAAAAAALNYGMYRLARDTPFRAWYAHLNLAVGAALITAVLYGLGPGGHLLYAAYLIAPLQVARGTLAKIEGGDLTARVDDPEHDELGYLGLSLGRTTDSIGEIVRQVQRQAHELAATAEQLAASAEELQASSQEISATT